MREEERKIIQEVIEILDIYLGDTDPDDLDVEDEFCSEEYPIHYCYHKLSSITGVD
ncbi:hypothetical protein [uncultured Arcobacter sp.]|uniref:hypothetical protein n=1 Tax=uncultured Arcobacter sp. TaxID=165434 RepID=UPI00262AC290|nr:hypothetical protein [uncultured Arcobacter sp.]